jgi:hypothetical protein
LILLPQQLGAPVVPHSGSTITSQCTRIMLGNNPKRDLQKLSSKVIHQKAEPYIKKNARGSKN